MENKAKNRGWIYAEKEIHRDWFECIRQGKIGREWYLLIYRKKLDFVFSFIERNGVGKKILDAGCGEGIIVEEFRKRGFNIEGIDSNYESKFVKRADITSIPYDDNYFDIILLLDVLEHIPYDRQYVALREIKRVLKPDGFFLVSIPNLAHLGSRIKFFFFGELSRTDKDFNHVGERTYREMKKILNSMGFEILEEKGITLTLPPFWQIITHFPQKFAWLHDIIDKFSIPHLALVNIFVAKNKK